MPERGDEKGRWENPQKADTWQEREHDAVFNTLDQALGDVTFPASKSQLAEQAGHVNVTDDTALPLVKYLQILPDKRYKSTGEVKAELDARWQEASGLRDAGYEPTAGGGGR